jgi:cellulose biosynthesis protein BcsQ
MFNSMRDRSGWTGRLLGILPTFFDEQTIESAKSLKDLQDAFGENVLNPIHRATVLRECAAEGKTIFELAVTSRASREYEELSRETVKRS